MLGGGIADKLGNRYEAKWLVSKLLAVLSGESTDLTFEGISADHAGFEFCLNRNGITEWHQTKINSPGGNWTLNALKNAGVLSAFSKRLIGSTNDTCHFISQDKTTDLRALSEESRMSSNVDEFLEVISESKAENFEKLKNIWTINDLNTWKFLRRIYVETRPESGIDEVIYYQARFLIENDVDIFPILRDFAEERINQVIATENMRNWVALNPLLEFKIWQQPRRILDKVNSAKERYLSTYIPFGLGGERLSRNEADEILHDLADPDGAKIIVCSGVAGSGKSGVIREVSETLSLDGIPNLPLRVDQHLDCPSSIALGEHVLGLNESPVFTLKSLAPKSTTVLIIDQLDAVSEVSGRDGAVKTAVFELIREAKHCEGVKILVACRAYDLENDAQFKELSQGYKTKKIHIPLLDWETEVFPLLTKLNFNPETILAHQIQLMRTPINLAIYIEIGEPEFSFKSQSDLFARLIKKKRKALLVQNYNWNLMETLEAIGIYMSETQTLTAPDTILDKYDGASDWLASENLIVINDVRINFFHESFFDFVYARAFISSDKSLLNDLLLTSEQHLFRRTQTRQILTLLRETHPTRYLDQLQQVLSSGEVRFHIKLSIAQWLQSVSDPKPEELKVLWGLFDISEIKTLKYTIFFSSSNWFSLLKSEGLVKSQLNNSNQIVKNITLRWLSNIAGEFPGEISRIVRDWWQREPKKTDELIDWFGFLRRRNPDDALLQLCEDVLDARPTNLFKDDGRDRIMMLLYSWTEHDPDKCGRMVAKIFEAWFAANPDANLISREDFKLLDGSSLSELSKKSPRAFVEGTYLAIIKTVTDVVDAGSSGAAWYSLRSRHADRVIHGFDGLFQLFEDNIGILAKVDIVFTKDILAEFDFQIHPRFCGLHLKAIESNPKAFGEQMGKLLKSPQLFKAGYSGAEWKAFADAAKALLTHNSSLVSQVEERISKDRSEILRASQAWKMIREDSQSDWPTKEGVLWQLRNSGYRQWCMLKTIGDENLSIAGSVQLAKLDQKFFGQKIEEENGARWISTSSPINSDQAALMSDEHWISAILKYDTNEDKDWRRGGADGLCSRLQEQAKVNPEKFLKLFKKLPLDANYRYFSEILRGFREADIHDQKLLGEVLLHAHEHFKDKLSEQILSIVETKQSVIYQPGIRDIVLDYAINGENPASEAFSQDTGSEDSKVMSVNDLVTRGDRLVVRSAYGGRARAWEVLGQLFWHQTKLINDGWNWLENQIPQERSVAVRLQMFEAMKALFNSDKARYEKNLRQLIVQEGLEDSKVDPIYILATRYGVNMQKYIDYNFPGLASDLIRQLLSCDNEEAALIGWWWQCCEFFRHNRSGVLIKGFEVMSEQEKVLIADIAAASFNWTEEKNFAEGVLLKCFGDESQKVQSQASKVFSNIKSEEFIDYVDLAWKFIETPAFFSNAGPLFYSLDGAGCDVMNLVISAAERLLNSVIEMKDQHSGRATGIYKIQELLAQEYTSSESFPDARKKILDLVDLMLENEIHGTDKITAANDR